MGLFVCPGQSAVDAAGRPAPYQTPDDALVLLSCPFFCAKDPCLVLNNQQLKVYRTRFSNSSMRVSTPIYDWPTCARDPIQIPHIWAARVGSRIKKRYQSLLHL